MMRTKQLLALAKDELETASLLLENNRYRACISRSYYAMYHATQALMDSKGLNSRTHKGIIKLFGQHFIKTGEFEVEFARTLSDAYDLRQLSDYEETISLTQQQAETLFVAAKEFVHKVQEYCYPPN